MTIKSRVADLFRSAGYTLLRADTFNQIDADRSRFKADAENASKKIDELSQAVHAQAEAVNFQSQALQDKESKRASRGRQQEALYKKIESITAADYYFAMDVVGTCNLACPSCPVGNSAKQIPTGLMAFSTYEKIIEKICQEHEGEKVFIDLFNWGESVLNKSLPQMINLANQRNIGIGLSTNLNSFPNMREVIRSRPAYIRISLSGYFNETYKQTHVGGDANVVKANMHLLRHHMNEVGIEIPIQVGFHIYKTNFPTDFNAMRNLCDELGFYFMPSIATFMPLEKALRIEDGTLPEADKQLLDKLIIPMQERTEILAKNRPEKFDCEYRYRRTALNHDGSVALCCATYENDQVIATNYLEVSRKELRARRYKHPFCHKCMNNNLDLIFTGHDSHLIENRAIEVLGGEFKEFMEDKTRPWLSP